MVWLSKVFAVRTKTLQDISKTIRDTPKNSTERWNLILLRKKDTPEPPAENNDQALPEPDFSSPAPKTLQELRFGNLNKFDSRGVELKFDIYEDKHTRPSQGDPLIILHGLLGCKENWRNICEKLVKKLNPPRKIIVADLRNHGDSPHTMEHTYELMGCDLLKLMKNLKLPKAHVLGHSMGGRAAMYVALSKPKLFSTLIVVDTSPVSTAEELFEILPKIFETLQKCQVEYLRGTLASVRKEAEDVMKQDIDDKAFRAFLLRNLKQVDDGSYRWRMNIVAITKHLSEIKHFPDMVKGKECKRPALFLGGELSHFLPKSDIEPIKTLFPQAQFEFIKLAGHLVFTDSPLLFVQRITAFLNHQKS